MTERDLTARERPHRPRVTLAIPTFNRAAWIGQAVTAALGQTYPDFEVLVSDNASTDGTESVLAQFDDPRLRVVRQPFNLGLVGNWNACLAEARGDYIAIVPDDDRVSPWFLARCMTLADREPGLPIVLALSDLELAGSGERILQAIPNKRLATGIWDGVAILREFLEDRLSAQMCSILMRTDAMRAGGGFPHDMPFALDKAGWAPLLLCGRAGFVNESCGTFIEHETNHTHSLNAELCLDDEWRFSELLTRLARTKVAEESRQRAVVTGAMHYFGRRVLEILATYRKTGASLSDGLALAWRWKSGLAQLRIASLVRFVRLVAVLLLPAMLTEQMRRLKHKPRRDPVRTLPSADSNHATADSRRGPAELSGKAGGLSCAFWSPAIGVISALF